MMTPDDKTLMSEIDRAMGHGSNNWRELASVGLLSPTDLEGGLEFLDTAEQEQCKAALSDYHREVLSNILEWRTAVNSDPAFPKDADLLTSFWKSPVLLQPQMLEAGLAFISALGATRIATVLKRQMTESVASATTIGRSMRRESSARLHEGEQRSTLASTATAVRFPWHGIELPSRVVLDEKSRSPEFGRFTIEPFERGFGTTVGNSLRRILLSSVEGAAVTKVKIGGVQHEFSTMPGVMEDVSDIILNIKGLIVSLEGDEPRLMRLSASGPGVVSADLLEADIAVTIHNPDHVICTLTDAIDFEAELTVAKGRGYQPASEQYARRDEQVIGEIFVDAVFSPVQRVRYRVENARVGQKTNYDKLIMDIWTDGTVTPEMVLVEAAKILRKHLTPFVQYFDVGSPEVSAEASVTTGVDDDLIRKLNMPIGDLDLTVRAANCLNSAKVHTVAELVTKDEADLLAVRSFGKTSLREVKRKLEEMGLTLGMKLPESLSSQVKHEMR